MALLRGNNKFMEQEKNNELKVAKPVILSKEFESILNKIGEDVHKAFWNHREQEINNLLRIHDITIETAYKKGFMLSVQKVDGNDCLIISRIISQHQGLTSIENFVDQVMKNSGL